MKKVLFGFALLISILVIAMAFGEGNKTWDSAPEITVAYEMSAEKIYLEWEGHSLLYQVQMDGKKIMDVGQPKAIIPVKKGTHSIVIYPTNSEKADKKTVSGSIDGIGSFGLDLSSLGIGGQDLTFGNASEALYIDYNPNPILNAVPDKLTAETVNGNNVKLSFVDRYNSDAYLVTIKSGNDVNYIQFNAYDDSAAYISRDKGISSVVLDQDYLAGNNCMVPELNEKYSFQVQLRKCANNLVNREAIKTVMLESKPSKWQDYTPIAAWKTAPVITFASQIADGQAKISWEHESYGTDVEYSIVKSNKTFFVKTGEEILGETKNKEFTINDLTNGSYDLSIVPNYLGEKGPYSETMNIEIKNEWVVAPSLTCEQVGANQVKLNWIAPENIEKYYITIYAGDSNSLLRFVDMDYKKMFEDEVEATAGSMEYIYTYNANTESDAAIRLKIEVYGIRHTQSGEEQKSAVSSASLVLE